MRKLVFLLFCITLLFSAKATAEEKILRLGSDDKVTTMIPYEMVSFADQHFGSSLFASLTEFSRDGKLEPGLAERWESLDGATRFRFYIRPNLIWSDGAPMTAETIKESFLGMLKNPASSPNDVLTIIDGAERFRKGETGAETVGISVINGNILEFRLNKPARYLPIVLHRVLYAPAPTHLIDVNVPHEDLEISPNFAFSGPFMLTEVSPNRYLAKRNPNYFDAKNVALDGYETLNLESNFAAAYDMIKKGELHIARLTAPKDNEISKRYLDPYTVTFDTNIINYLVLNSSKPPFDSEPLRRAISLATDPALGGIIEQTDTYKQMHSLIPPVMFDYPGDVPAEWDDWPMPHRIEKAKEIIEGLGYSDKNPLTIKLSLIDHPAHYTVGNALRAMWARVHLNVEFVVKKMKPHFESLEQQNFEIARSGKISNTNNLHDYLTLLETNNPGNYGLWSNSEYDDLISKAQATDDKEEAKRLQKKALTIARRAAVWIPLYSRTDYILRNPRVIGPDPQETPSRSVKWYDLAPE